MRPSIQASPRVLYICGWGRSGSTLVDRVIGAVPGFVSVGELRTLWDSDPAVHRCGCGVVVAACPLWGPLLEAMYAASGYTQRSIRSRRNETTRSRHLPGLWWSARRSQSALEARSPYGDVLEGLYRGVLAATDSAVVVDSSKHPADALLLAQQPHVDLTVLHLVRDPRGVAYSWHRRPAPDGPTPSGPVDRPPHRGVTSSAAWWTTWNGAIEGMLRPLLGPRYIRMRYEDIMVDPQEQLGIVVKRFGASASDLPFTGPRDVTLGPSHAVAGNPVRAQNGQIHIALDQEWRTQMSAIDRWRATLPALPLLNHYDYPLREARVLPPPPMRRGIRRNQTRDEAPKIG